MCGIAGVIHQDRATALSAVLAMNKAQAHRGPDDEGAELLPFGPHFLALGHRRLAILDLSPIGHQPITHRPTGGWLTYNGEIYNFKKLRHDLEREGENFAGCGDTEVLLAGLARHGASYLNRIEGMFALAYYDAANERLLLSRDSAGIKPLYYAHGDKSLIFGSEVRAVLATGLVRPQIDSRGLAGLLAYGAVQHPFTLFREIQSVPAGASVEIALRQDGRWTVGAAVQHWRFPSATLSLTEPEAVEQVRSVFDQAVHDHLISDVPVGIFLSSGLDSTIMAGLAARHVRNLHSFTVGFDDQQDLSEDRLAAETAALFGLDHVNISLSSDDAEAATQDWLGALDQPSMDGLNVFVISGAVRRHGIKVALSGQGGDELFGGYPSFRDVPRIRRLLSALKWMPRPARQGAVALAGLSRSKSSRNKLADTLSSDGSISSLALQRRRLMSNQQLACLGIQARLLGLTDDYQTGDALEEIASDGRDCVAVISRIESRFYQGNMLLRDADANGMAHGLEIRVPFLDRRMLNFVHALPGTLRLPPGSPGKHLLRQAFSGLLRSKLQKQAKRGFTLPIRRWMMGSLQSWCQQSLQVASELGGLRADGVRSIWQAFLKSPESPIWTRAFTLCVLGNYLNRTGATI
jgi:asparagine synthase (glutamine-hydrolysing)